MDNFENKIDEKSLFSLINFVDQTNKYLLINSLLPINEIEFDLKDPFFQKVYTELLHIIFLNCYYYIKKPSFEGFFILLKYIFIIMTHIFPYISLPYLPFLHIVQWP